LADSEEPATSAGTRPHPEPSTIVLVMTGPITRADVPILCDRIRVLLEGSDADLVICDMGVLVKPDAATIEVLARLQLTARRLRRQVQVLDACGELRDLLALTGLSDVVPPCGELTPRAEEEGRTGGTSAAYPRRS
jgi:ABC-type transporter Mla MlaB component